MIFFFSLSDNGTYHFWSLSFPWRLKSNINCICWIRRRGKKKSINLSLRVSKRSEKNQAGSKSDIQNPNYMLYFYSTSRCYTRLGSSNDTKDSAEQGQPSQRQKKARRSFREGRQNRGLGSAYTPISDLPHPALLWFHLDFLPKMTEKQHSRLFQYPTSFPIQPIKP